MPRPTTKAALLAALDTEHAKLEQALRGLTDAQLTAVSPQTGWSIKDVLAHLSEWEQMCLGWYRAGLAGKTPALPAEGYNWAQLPALNRVIFDRYHADPLTSVRKHFSTSFRQIKSAIGAIDEDTLFGPQRFAWTGRNLLAAYFISATSSHYVWAQKEIRKCLRS